LSSACDRMGRSGGPAGPKLPCLFARQIRKNA
jgi:hypothetical protein